MSGVDLERDPTSPFSRHRPPDESHGRVQTLAESRHGGGFEPGAHDAWTQDAALAFSMLFSPAPVLVVVGSVSGAFLGRARVRTRVARGATDQGVTTGAGGVNETGCCAAGAVAAAAAGVTLVDGST